MGNFSRDTFDDLKRYVGVRLQQGVPIVDADWNELEDIRKFELQAFLKWFVGNGAPAGNDGFNILPSGQPNDFTIEADGTGLGGAGRLLVDGMDVFNETPLAFSAQPLYNNPVLAASWGVAPIQPLSTPTTNRTDTVYIDVWEREVNAIEDPDLINPSIGVETCVRSKREWAVRVEENSTTPPANSPAGHSFYALAELSRIGGDASIGAGTIRDTRQTGLSLSDLQSEIVQARGSRASLDDRLDQSLTESGQLRPDAVTPAQIGALAESDYDFRNRGTATILYTQSNSHNAPTSINLGFRPRFVWASASIRASMVSGFFGVSSHGFADLQSGIIQRGARDQIYRTSAVPYWRQDSLPINGYLCRAFFSDVASSPDRVGEFGARIAAVSNTGLTMRFFRDDPTTSTGTGTGGGGGTGTAATSTQAFSNFQVRLQLLCFG